MTAGITGHQKLGDATAQGWVIREIEHWLIMNPVSVGYSSLAMGADQLFARCILASGSSLEAIIPCANYESTFQDEVALTQFNQLVKRASSVIRLPYPHPCEEAFWAAGRWIADHANILVAVWNGQPAAGLGGTADVVDYARKIQKPLWHINPITRSANALDTGNAVRVRPES